MARVMQVAAYGAYVGRAVRSLCVLAVIGISLLLASAAGASGPSTGIAGGSSLARLGALRAYRHDRALDRYRRHEREASSRRARASVVGGALESIEAVPWQVAVFAEFEVEGEQEAFLCGGSIIDLSHVLTAGHCAIDPETGQPLPSESFVVLAGASAITAEEIEKGPTVEARRAVANRVHPDFDYAAGPSTPDDIAVLQLAQPLVASSGVAPIGLPSGSVAPAVGTNAVLSGFGEENPLTEELNGNLYSLGVSLGFSRECSGEADALFLCGSSAGGSACSGDSGGGVVEGSPSQLIGVVDIVEVLAGQRCRDGALNGFVNLAAPEVRDFVEGSEDPPRAPRGGGVVVRGVPAVGQSLACEPGSWSNGPSFTYAFTNGEGGPVLQQGASSAYALSGADLGRSISCEVLATNAGGTGLARTEGLGPIEQAVGLTSPPSIGVGSAGSASTPAGSAGGTGAGQPASGGVLGAGIAHLSSAQLEALLVKELAPAGKAAKLATVFHAGGFAVTFAAPEAGTAVIDWYFLPPGAKIATNSKAKPLLVASGHMRFSTKRTAKLDVRLTAAGKRRLEAASSLKITASGTFTPTGGAPVHASKAFILKR